MADSFGSFPIINEVIEASKKCSADTSVSLGFIAGEAGSIPARPTHRFSFSVQAPEFVPCPLHERVESESKKLFAWESSRSDLFDWTNFSKPYGQETKIKHEVVMAQWISSRDIFDSVAWDPDLASLPSPDKSPEPVDIKPQPVAVAYTTVGSVVNPRAAPQFSAPHRIQREGALQRKSLMSILQTYDSDAINVQLRAPLPPLSKTNSMQYTQQLGRNTNQPVSALQPITNHLSQPAGSSLPDISSMSDDDLRILIYSLGHRLLTENDAPLNASVRGMAEEELATRSGSHSCGPIQGMEKMQTVQRLSKFPNPMQKVAQNKLSEFSVLARSDMSTLDTTSISQGSGEITDNRNTTEALVHQVTARLGDLSAGQMNKNFEDAGGFAAYINRAEQNAQYNNRHLNEGELDRAFQFPPTSIPSVTQANPLYRANGLRNLPASRPAQTLAVPQSLGLSHPAGYPQPLTAGPPGQRHWAAAISFGSSLAVADETWPAEHIGESYNPLKSEFAAPIAPKGQKAGERSSSGQTEIIYKPHPDYKAQNGVIDTLLPMDAAKYYPGGLPSNMTGYHLPVSEEDFRKFNFLPDLTEEERRAKELDTIDDRFYYGSRRIFTMSCADYDAELQHKQANPFGPIAPPRKVELQKKSVEEWNNMSKTEEAAALAPFLNAAYGSLLAYTDKMPGNRFSLSQWRDAEEELIDRSKYGNKSYFGEDWGAPPKNSSAMLAPSRPNDAPNPKSASQILAARHMQQR